MRLEYKEKMKIVEMRNQGYTWIEISKQVGANSSNVRKYMRLYRQYGEEIFQRKKFNSEYSLELKLEIIKRFKLGESKTSLAVEYKIEVSIILKWVRAYEEMGYNGLITKKRGRQKMGPKKDENINNESESNDISVSSPLTDEERLEYIRLKAEYKKLQKEKEISDMENEFLKKLDALVQERLKREGKK